MKISKFRGMNTVRGPRGGDVNEATDTQDFAIQAGVLATRPGFVKLNPTAYAAAITGIFPFSNSRGRYMVFPYDEYMIRQTLLSPNFVAGPLSGIVPLTCFFLDVTYDPYGDGTAWFWDFGDGTTSTDHYPVHTYAAAGVYTVSFTVIAGSLRFTRTREKYIGVMNADGTFPDGWIKWPWVPFPGMDDAGDNVGGDGDEQAPKIASVTPNHVTVGYEATALTIAGDNLAANFFLNAGIFNSGVDVLSLLTGVTFGSIIGLLGTGLPVGTYDVMVANRYGGENGQVKYAILEGGFEVRPPAAVVTGISPANIYQGYKTPVAVSITGTDLEQTVGVTVGGLDCTDVIASEDGLTVTCAIPIGLTIDEDQWNKQFDVVVTDAYGQTATLAGGFEVFKGAASFAGIYPQELCVGYPAWPVDVVMYIYFANTAAYTGSFETLLADLIKDFKIGGLVLTDMASATISDSGGEAGTAYVIFDVTATLPAGLTTGLHDALFESNGDIDVTEPSYFGICPVVNLTTDYGSSGANHFGLWGGGVWKEYEGFTWITQATLLNPDLDQGYISMVLTALDAYLVGLVANLDLPAVLEFRITHFESGDDIWVNVENPALYLFASNVNAQTTPNPLTVSLPIALVDGSHTYIGVWFAGVPEPLTGGSGSIPSTRRLIVSYTVTLDPTAYCRDWINFAH